MCIRAVILLLIALPRVGMPNSLPAATTRADASRQRPAVDKFFPLALRYRQQIDRQIRLSGSEGRFPAGETTSALPGRPAGPGAPPCSGFVLLHRLKRLLL